MALLYSRFFAASNPRAECPPGSLGLAAGALPALCGARFFAYKTPLGNAANASARIMTVPTLQVFMFVTLLAADVNRLQASAAFFEIRQRPDGAGEHDETRGRKLFETLRR